MGISMDSFRLSIVIGMVMRKFVIGLLMLRFMVVFLVGSGDFIFIMVFNVLRMFGKGMKYGIVVLMLWQVVVILWLSLWVFIMVIMLIEKESVIIYGFLRFGRLQCLRVVMQLSVRQQLVKNVESIVSMRKSQGSYGLFGGIFLVGKMKSMILLFFFLRVVQQLRFLSFLRIFLKFFLQMLRILKIVMCLLKL